MSDNVHEVLRDRREQILGTWEALVAAEVRRVEIGGPALRDGVPEILEALAGWLESGGPAEDRGVGAEALRYVIRRHGQGLDLAQVLGEFRLLNEAILRVLLEAEPGEEPATPRRALGREGGVIQLARLNAGLDLALAYAIEHLVAERTSAAAARARTAERKLAAVIDQLPVAVGVLDMEGHFVIGNAELQKFGLRRGPPSRVPEERGKWTALDEQGRRLPPERWPSARALRGETVYPGLSCTYRPEPGREIHTVVSSVPFRDEAGHQTGAIAVIQDVTPLVRAREEARASEERARLKASELETVLDAVPAAVWIARDPRGDRIDANGLGRELLHRRAGENVSLTSPDADRPRNFTVQRQGRVLEPGELPIQKAARGAESRDTELDVVFDSGEVRHLLGSAVPLRDGDGRPVGSVGAFIDVTGRKLAEERLAADLAALRRIHALSGRAIEPGGLGSLLQETMDAAVAIMAADRGTLQLLEGDSLVIAAHHRHEKPFLEFFAQARTAAPVSSEAARRGERVLVPDVENSPVLAGTASLPVLRAAGVRAVQSTPLRTRSGRLLGSLTTQWREPHMPDEHDLWRLDLLVRQAADLIELKQAEEERLAAARALEAANAGLREADHRKDQFLALLGHELRNPLAPISNSAYILRHAGPGSEEAERARTVIERQTEHLARLVDDLLDVTRISAGKVTLVRERMDLREIVRMTTHDLHDLSEEAGVETRLEPTGLAPLWVDVDPTRISQVVGNLLQNAVKFTPAGGSVSVSVLARGDTAEVRVRDTGIGMEPATIQIMFEAFAQAEQSLARSNGGLGLGLALARGLVELHGGTIEASSEGMGRGSELVVRLPLSAGGESADPVPEAVAARRRSVLIIDDNPDVARSLADVLELQGHEVTLARDGQSGFELAREKQPDVVLCDLGLPDLDGYEVARRLRREECLRATRLFALSGYARPEDRDRSRAAGFDAHIAKPPNLDELSRIVAQGP